MAGGDLTAITDPLKIIPQGDSTISRLLDPLRIAQRPKTPEAPKAPEPAPGRDSPEADEASRQQLLAEKRRRGARASILVKNEDDELGTVNRPEASSPSQPKTNTLG